MIKSLMLLLVTVGVGITALGLVADEYEERFEARDKEDHEYRELEGGRSSKYLSDTRYALYQNECGDCHMAYPPPMLPDSSWQGMIASLEDHFGDNAEVDAATADSISAFLVDNAAGKGSGAYGARVWRATRDRSPPDRITQTDYFRGQHHEIPAKMVKGNPEVVSFSRCEVCHRGAAQGNFDEHGVRIPGYGRWDD